jgi:hypothetical protein
MESTKSISKKMRAAGHSERKVAETIEIVKALREDSQDYEVENGKITAQIWEEKEDGSHDYEWIEIKSLVQYNAIYEDLVPDGTEI